MIPNFTPSPSYTTPDLVAEALNLRNTHDPNERFVFSNKSNPTFNYVCRMICSNEGEIDRRTNSSWRPNYIKGEWMELPNYQHDENSWRADYWKYGGIKLQLHPHVLPWDPRPVYRRIDSDTGEITYSHDEPEEGETGVVKIYNGDKIELRSALGGGGTATGWHEMPDEESASVMVPTDGFQIDYNDGVLYLRTRTPFRIYTNIRISYRWGMSYEEEVPEEVIRLCTVMTAKEIVNNQPWVIKVGGGGDIAGIKEQIIKGFDEKISELFTTLQQPLAVYSMIQR